MVFKKQVCYSSNYPRLHNAAATSQMVSLATEHAPPNVVQEGDGSLRVCDLTTDAPMAAQESLYILHEQADCFGSDAKVGSEEPLETNHIPRVMCMSLTNATTIEPKGSNINVLWYRHVRRSGQHERPLHAQTAAPWPVTAAITLDFTILQRIHKCPRAVGGPWAQLDL